MHITYFTFSCLRKYLLFFTRGCVCWDERGSGLWGEDEIIVYFKINNFRPLVVNHSSLLPHNHKGNKKIV